MEPYDIQLMALLLPPSHAVWRWWGVSSGGFGTQGSLHAASQRFWSLSSLALIALLPFSTGIHALYFSALLVSYPSLPSYLSWATLVSPFLSLATDRLVTSLPGNLSPLRFFFFFFFLLTSTGFTHSFTSCPVSCIFWFSLSTFFTQECLVLSHACLSCGPCVSSPQGCLPRFPLRDTCGRLVGPTCHPTNMHIWVSKHILGMRFPLPHPWSCLSLNSSLFLSLLYLYFTINYIPCFYRRTITRFAPDKWYKATKRVEPPCVPTNIPVIQVITYHPYRCKRPLVLKASTCLRSLSNHALVNSGLLLYFTLWHQCYYHV